MWTQTQIIRTTYHHHDINGVKLAIDLIYCRSWVDIEFAAEEYRSVAFKSGLDSPLRSENFHIASAASLIATPKQAFDSGRTICDVLA